MAQKTHIIRDGDTLSSIAAQYGVSPQSLADLNRLSINDALYSGNSLTLPDLPQASAAASRPAYTPADTSAAANAAAALKLVDAARPSYSASDALKEAESLLKNWENNRPADYVSSYDAQIADLLSKLESRPAFSYDPAADPLYGLYRDQYVRQGQMAMLDSMANAAALSGGYANSYAVTTGNQAYQGYLAQLNGVIPQLYAQSYARYQDEGQALADALDRYRELDAASYGRWRDDVDDYYEDLSYYYNRYSDMSRDEYETYQQNLAAWQKDRDYWYKRAQDEQAQANWQAEFALAQAKAASTGGGGSSRRSSGGTSSSASGNTSRYNTLLNGLKQTVRIKVNAGESKTGIYASINNQVNEFLSNDFISSAQAKQMRAVAQSFYATQQRKKNS